MRTFNDMRVGWSARELGAFEAHLLGDASQISLFEVVLVRWDQNLTANEVAARYGVSKDSIWWWCHTSQGFPQGIKISDGVIPS